MIIFFMIIIQITLGSYVTLQIIFKLTFLATLLIHFTLLQLELNMKKIKPSLFLEANGICKYYRKDHISKLINTFIKL